MENVNKTPEGYKISGIQKVMLSGFVSSMKKFGVKHIFLTLDENAENGMKIDFYVKDAKVLTLDELDELKKMIEL